MAVILDFPKFHAAKLGAKSYRIHVGRASGPAALLVFRRDNCFSTMSTPMINLSGTVSHVRAVYKMEGSRGGMS